MAAYGSRQSHVSMLTIARDASGAEITVSTLAAHRARGQQRPACFCLSCNRPLVARLGAKRRHHFAHFPDTQSPPCWGSYPEGATHLSAKEKLRRFLEAACTDGRAVLASLPCPHCRTRSIRFQVATLTPNQRVLVEHWLDPRKSLKPDLQLVGADGEIRLIVEVCVTHESSDDKLQFAHTATIPLLEVDGHLVMESDLEDGALPCIAAVNIVAPAACEQCTGRLFQAAQVKREQAEAAAEQKRERAEAAAALQRLEIQAKELLPEAEARARDALANVEHTTSFYLRVPPPVRFQVWITWYGSTVTLELTFPARPTLRRWTGTSEEIAHIYVTELAQEVRAHANLPADWTPHNSEIPDFSRPPPESHPYWRNAVHNELRRLMSPGPHVKAFFDRRMGWRG